MKCAFRPVIALALLSALVTAPAMAQVDSREGIALQNQISELRRDIDSLRQNGGGDQRSGGSLLGSGRRNAPAPADESNAATGGLAPEMLDRINRLEDSVRQLNGRVDELANAQSRAQADLAKQISDIQFRLDNGGPAAAAPALSPPPAPAAAPPKPTAARSPEQLLQEGGAALARRDYAGAEANARQVLAAGKSTPRGYDAQLLLAQALSGEKKSVDAALAYGDLYQHNKQGQHAQDALLGLASSQMQLGDKRSTCVALETLKAQFPTPRSDIGPRAAQLRASAACR